MKPNSQPASPENVSLTSFSDIKQSKRIEFGVLNRKAILMLKTKHSMNREAEKLCRFALGKPLRAFGIMDARKAKIPSFYMEFLRALCMMFAVSPELKWRSYVPKFSEDAWRSTTYAELQLIGQKLVHRLQGQFTQHEVKFGLRAFEKAEFIERLSPFDPKAKRRFLYLRLRADRIIFILQKLHYVDGNDIIPPMRPAKKPGSVSPANTGEAAASSTVNNHPIFISTKHPIPELCNAEHECQRSVPEQCAVPGALEKGENKLKPPPASPAGLEICLISLKPTDKEKRFDAILQLIKSGLFNDPETHLTPEQLKKISLWSYHPLESSRMTLSALQEYSQFRNASPYYPDDWFINCSPDFLIQNWPVVYKHFKRRQHSNDFHFAELCLNNGVDPVKEFEDTLLSIALEIQQSGKYPTGGNPDHMVLGLIVATIRQDADAIAEYSNWILNIKKAIHNSPGFALLARKLYPQALLNLGLSSAHWKQIEENHHRNYQQLLVDKAIGDILEIPS